MSAIESRIIKVADVYQALAQDRPYRRPMAPEGILAMLREMLFTAGPPPAATAAACP